MKFRHIVPKTLWHVGHAKSGIFPLPDGNGFIKPPPEQTIGGFFRRRRRHGKGFQRHYARNTPGIQQCFGMGFVVNEKRFVAVAITKMAAKKRKNAVFGRDLRRQHTVKFAEANKPLEKMGFAIHVPHGFEQRLVVIVCKAAQ